MGVSERDWGTCSELFRGSRNDLAAIKKEGISAKLPCIEARPPANTLHTEYE